MESKITVSKARIEYALNGGKVIDDTIDGFVVLKDINKVYGNRVQAVFNFNLSVDRNEFVVLVGPSGCGKSTTLRMIAGLEEITSGKLFIDNVLANYLESKDRDIAMVFQSYALYPNMSVYDNIGFGLTVRKLPREEIRKRVFRAAEILDLGNYLDRKPKELSGGQMQRVALGRAIVRDAKLFLMDEPLSNLDAKLRVQMRSEIVKLHRSIGATTIYVTHDQTEAMTMADRIVIMNKGLVQQIGSPMEVYDNPANVFVATFIGNPPMNVFRAYIGDGKIHCDEKQEIELPKGLLAKYREFIEERRAFFTELKAKVADDSEKTLLADIDTLAKLASKKPFTEVRDEFTAILERAKELSNWKGFFSLPDEQIQTFVADLDTNSISVVKTNLAELAKLIQNTDLAVAGILKEVDSSNMRAVKQDVVIVEKKKRGLKKLFAKREPQETLAQENARKIDEYLKLYLDGDIMDNALVGIRPEDIHFESAASIKNKSNGIVTKAELVELLGSEFCMHVTMFNVNIIVKSGARNVVKTGDEVKLCIDMDRLKIFDPVSGKTINK